MRIKRTVGRAAAVDVPGRGREVLVPEVGGDRPTPPPSAIRVTQVLRRTWVPRQGRPERFTRAFILDVVLLVVAALVAEDDPAGAR
jgi:hypothetical protein